MARHFTVETPLPKAKAELALLAARLTPQTRPGDYAQAVMDLGATICTPRSPSCLICPVADDCAGRDAAEAYPVKAPKAAKPHRTGVCWWIEREADVFLVTRDATQMLGGMRALPSDGWDKKRHPELVSGSMPQDSRKSGCSQSSRQDEAWILKRVQYDGEASLGTITHIFTHFSLTLEIRRVTLKAGCSLELDGEWWPKAKLGEAGLPSLFVKAAYLAIGSE